MTGKNSFILGKTLSYPKKKLPRAFVAINLGESLGRIKNLFYNISS
jgi:hypothetical protein